MWILYLNDMRSPKIEYLEPVARANTREELEAFLTKERVDHYRDEQWGKAFRKGGPLEWFNPPIGVFDPRHFFDFDREVEKTRTSLKAIPDVSGG